MTVHTFLWSCLCWFVASAALPCAWVFLFRRHLSMADKLKFCGIVAAVVVITILTFFAPWAYEILKQ